jgi:F-type H+-transporting ATPase subunit gamma
MATLRELKGRIGSVASSEKITGAMKMISSAKMHKAEQALKRLSPFRHQVESILANLLSADARFSSPLLETRDIHSVALVVWGSDDGLCGAYNVNIHKLVAQAVKDYRAAYGDDVSITVIPVGSKIAKVAAKLSAQGVNIDVPQGIDSKSGGAAVKTMADDLCRRFVGGEFDRVETLYMQFKSASRQRAVKEQLLPVSQTSFTPAGSAVESNRPYIFEPDASTIFNSVLPMYLLAVVQDVFTENRASEQAARIMAMQSANDNAKKLLEQLQLEYNKLRQQSITTELLDIIGGQVK